jgi:DNA-binding Lrp family transcriptional regulator
MRPTTLRRVVEVCRLAKNGKISINKIMDALGISKSRAIEIARELQVMNLLIINYEHCIPNPNTLFFMENFENENWDDIHSFFFVNYPFYRTYIDLLTKYLEVGQGMSFDSLQREVKRQGLNLNRTSIEVLTDWCDRLGIVQRHLYSGHIYMLKTAEFNLIEFKEQLISCFDLLVRDSKPREVFVEIPRIREDVCERCKIRRVVFDELLRRLYRQNIGKIELCGAPITTLAKKSPLSEKRIETYSKDGILAPKYLLRKEREGLLINDKSYYYLAIYNDLSIST